ncbi:MAG: hypothetical protein LLG05_11610 [Porphyromonadaceae bacterium]|nr:hypothetical protein [Porphyromonadaceae bacterium]
MNPTKEQILEPIQNALYATGRFIPEECTELASGILRYIEDAGYSVIKTRKEEQK